jgi:DNA-binding transcriptional LysR family regulator
VVRRDHPQVGERLTLDQYCRLQHVLVSSERIAPGVVDRALAARGRERQVALRLSHFLMVPRILAITDYVAALSSRVAEPFARELPLRVLRPPLPLPEGTVGMVWHQRTDRSPAHAWLRGVVAAIGKEVTKQAPRAVRARVAPRAKKAARRTVGPVDRTS